MLEDRYLKEEQVRIWDEELPSFFKDGTFPEIELETYGLQIAYKASDHTLKVIVEWLDEKGLVYQPQICDEYFIHIRESELRALKELVK